MKILRYIDKLIAKIEHWLIVASLSIMVLMTFFHVILRAIYTHGHIQWANRILGHVDWSESLVRLLILWVTFLGASLLTGDDRHIRIDILTSILPKKWLSIRKTILSLSCMIICSLILKASIDYVVLEAEFGGELFLGVPVWVGQLIVPIGFSVILFRFFLIAIKGTLESVLGE